MAKNKVKTKVKFNEVDAIPLDKYLERGGDVLPKTIRAPEMLWARVDTLSSMKKCSVNTLLTAMMEKICDEEGIVF